MEIITPSILKCQKKTDDFKMYFKVVSSFSWKDVTYRTSNVDSMQRSMNLFAISWYIFIYGSRQLRAFRGGWQSPQSWKTRAGSLHARKRQIHGCTKKKMASLQLSRHSIWSHALALDRPLNLTQYAYPWRYFAVYTLLAISSAASPSNFLRVEMDFFVDMEKDAFFMHIERQSLLLMADEEESLSETTCGTPKESKTSQYLPTETRNIF